jgi:hypothetical protein
LIASKVASFISRYGHEKSGTDRRDLTALPRRFPDLKTRDGRVESLLKDRGVCSEVLSFWHELVEQELVAEDEDNDLIF